MKNGLHMRSVIKSYSDFSLQADFSVVHGSLTTLLGPSGCGKSTTLSLITGLLRPDSGSIELDGRDLSQVPIWKRNIGVVFQDHALFPNYSVAGNIQYPLKIQRLSRQEMTERTRELLSLVSLDGYQGRSVNALSGGERQRVALARALATDPSLLLLDEPLSALDAQLRLSMRNEIRALQRRLGLTVLYITHDQEEALSISDQVILMHDGRVEQQGPPEEIYRSPATRFAAEFIGRSTIIPMSSLIEGLERGSSAPLVTILPNSHPESLCCIRPEEFTLSDGTVREDGPPPPDILRFKNAVSVRSDYTGGSYLHLFSWNGHSLIMRSSERLIPDKPYTLKVAASKVNILKV